MTNTTTLQTHLEWALNELDRYVTIGGDGIARNRCEGQVVDGYTDPYSAARKSLTVPSLKAGQRVQIAFAADPGFNNGYIGEATLCERLDWSEAGPHWRVSVPNGDDDIWFPETSITPFL